jgi:hypothetical protein
MKDSALRNFISSFRDFTPELESDVINEAFSSILLCNTLYFCASLLM